MGRSHAAGWASDSPTPDQLKEFFAQIGDHRITKGRLQAFLLGRTVVGDQLTEAEQQAVEILGPGRVLTRPDVCRVQKGEMFAIEPVMLYTKDVLRESAEANARGLANWQLAYAVGHSFRREREIMGWDRESQPCFDPVSTWWLEERQDFWATTSVEPGYWLLDFTKRFPLTFWDNQETAIGGLGADFERAKGQVVVEICSSKFLLSPNKERLMEDWCHWGELQTHSGNHVLVGFFEQRGLEVRDYASDHTPYDYLGVVVARKRRATTP